MGSVDDVFELVLVDMGEFTVSVEAVCLCMDGLRESLESVHWESL